MSTVNLLWTLPPQDAHDASGVDVFDGATQIGSVAADVTTFTTGDLEPGDHSFTVVVRSSAGPAFDSDASNAAVVTVPVVPVKLAAVTDLAATLVA